MDIKCGSGAFMETSARARELADSILGTAARTGLATHAIVTDMNQVLGDTAGNALEIREAVRYLRNEHRERRLDEVTVALCAQMLIVGGSEADSDTARQKVDDAIRSGRAAEKFASMVSAMGGPADFLDRYDTYLPQSAVVRPLHAARAGVLGKVDTHRIGNAIIELGGGRRVLGASLDLSVGFSEVAHVGDTVDDQRPLAIVHAASDDAADVAAELYRKACEIADEANAPPTAVIETIVPERAAN
jgi:thymidine phosphorylase